MNGNAEKFLALILLVACQSQTPTPAPTVQVCSIQNQFAYVGVDGNVHLYDLCTKNDDQLTSDSGLSEKREEDIYHFLGRSTQTWSSDEHILLKKQKTVYLLDTVKKQTTALGEYKQALWSPSGQWLILTQDDGKITIKDSRTLEETTVLDGYAPAWYSNDEIVYLGKVESVEIDPQQVEHQQQILKYNTLSKTTTYFASRLSTYTHAVYSELSSDHGYIAVYSPWVEYASNVSVIELDNKSVFQSNYMVEYRQYELPAFSWSPTTSTLVLCTAAGGSDSPESLPHLVVIESGQKTRTLDECFPYIKPQWSPDGKFIAYVSHRDTKIIDFEGINRQTIATENTGDLIWSANGRYLILVNDQIYIASVVDQPQIGTLDFSPIANGVEALWHP